ncbi:unnamed protein product [Spirodela intermedia]|uniref:H(+)-exporting diphosphatase n=1 Tax=Spirodela intermedia TaxID=51605 RepID=A0A7I8JR30_SPIIN|nr:unnamed protein product [Spirodela intermedia]CAA6672620.1 unnamed protein product [Spirodela intermedia]
MGAALLSDHAAEVLIPAAAAVGITFALVQWLLVSLLKLSPADDQRATRLLVLEEEEGLDDRAVVLKCAEIQSAISEGATSFLFTEYQYVGVFMAAFAVLVFLFLGSVEGFSTENQPCTYSKDKVCKPAVANALFSTIAFLLGATTSLTRKGVGKAFIAAFRSGAVMGFLLAANGLLVLYAAINLFKLYYGDDWEGLFEAITGYGLGGSSMALFGRVGGGIYTKAADVGADLVGKVERNIPEDDPRNPAVIADNVGDNVGDIAGWSSCAALVVASISSFGINHELAAMLYPLLVSSMGIIICLITTLFATDFFEIKSAKDIEPALKRQLTISTSLMTVGIAIVSWIALPPTFTIFNFGEQKMVTNWGLLFCVTVGLWAGLAIGFVTEYYTAIPVQDVADSCRTGAATNVIFGLALGYNSVIVPIFAIAISIFISFSLAAMYGIAMAGMSHQVRERTDALDAAGNTTAAIGKGFAIGSAALVSLALFGAFMVEEVRQQFNTISGLMEGTAKPDYATCVKISTDASIREMIPPRALVMLTPLIAGTIFGVETLAGLLAGALVSGVQIAISASNTGGAWDNAKKYIEAGASEHARSLGPKGSDSHNAAVIGDTIGDPLKDTSGPSLNFLIKLMAVESLVFAPFFAKHGGLLFKIF